LPKPSVDTGMGLERIAAVMQHVHSNYEIDLFVELLKEVQVVTGVKDSDNPSLNVIADHIRSCAFMIVDGVLPGNEGRGYVLRRIIRRAARHGHKLGATEPFFHKLVAPLVRLMGEAFPELKKVEQTVADALLGEERKFAETLNKGMKIFEEDLSSLKGKTVPGATLFKLYDTYGFPLDLTADIARERGLEVDEAGFEKAMEQQRTQARESSQLLDKTAFYGESGGQVGDSGQLKNISGDAVFEVVDTQKSGAALVHFGRVVEGQQIAVGEKLHGVVDSQQRSSTLKNHSATHLLHASLRRELGEHVQQKGSLVTPGALRFDFSHGEPVTDDQLQTIESWVNGQVMENARASTEEMSMDDAIAKGAMALFGEKYGDTVVISVSFASPTRLVLPLASVE